MSSTGHRRIQRRQHAHKHALCESVVFCAKQILRSEVHPIVSELGHEPCFSPKPRCTFAVISVSTNLQCFINELNWPNSSLLYLIKFSFLLMNTVNRAIDFCCQRPRTAQSIQTEHQYFPNERPFKMGEGCSIVLKKGIHFWK